MTDKKPDYSSSFPSLISRLFVIESACVDWQGPYSGGSTDTDFVHGVGMLLVEVRKELEEMDKGLHGDPAV